MELTLDQALQKGVEAHKAGNVQEADRYYTAILQAQPKHSDANHNMGVLAVGLGKVQEALPFFKTALETNASVAQYWLSYIDALIKLDKITDAKTVFEQAKSKGAKGNIFDQLEAKLGTLSSKNGNTQDPPQNQIKTLLDFYNKGLLQQTLEKATELAQQYPGSAILFNIQGVALQGLGNLKTAIQAYENALKLNPDYAEAYCNMGNALQEQRQLKEAVEAYSKAISLKPYLAEAYYNLGNAIREQGKLEEAIEAYSKAISINPDNVEAYYNMESPLEVLPLQNQIEVFRIQLFLYLISKVMADP